MNWKNYFDGNDHEEMEGNYIMRPRITNRDRAIKLTVVFTLSLVLFLMIMVGELLKVENTQNKAVLETKSLNSVNIPRHIETPREKPKKIQIKVYNYKRLTEAIMRYETGHFKSNAWLTKNNACGIMTWNSGKRSLKAFASPEAGKEACYRLVKLYFDKGLNTPEKMQPRYAPSGEKGNEHWVRSVKIIYGGLE